MNTTYLSLGTNLGNKTQNLRSALQKINNLGTVTKVSSVYQTPPWGFQSDDFYNISICLQTELEALKLLDILLGIETELGRLRNPEVIGYTARPLDIDILFFNNDVIDTTKLTLPHPRLHDRKFVLIPTIEIAPNYTHPKLRKTLEFLLQTTTDTSTIEKLSHIHIH